MPVSCAAPRAWSGASRRRGNGGPIRRSRRARTRSRSPEGARSVGEAVHHLDAGAGGRAAGDRVATGLGRSRCPISTRRRRPVGAPPSGARDAIRSSIRMASGFGRPSTKVGKEVEALCGAVPHDEQVLQLDGPVRLDHHPRRPRDFGDPRRQLIGIGDRGRQAHEGHIRGRAEDDLLPDTAPVGVLEVVNLVEHHIAQVRRGAPGPRGSCCAAPRSSSRRSAPAR